MKWLITGAGGLVGGKLAERLTTNGEYVIGVDLKGDLKASSYKEFYTVSVADSNAMHELFQKTRPDVAVHLAFIVGSTHRPRLEQRVAVEGTRNFFSACTESSVGTSVFISSAAAYGAYLNNPKFLKEESPLRGNADYSYAKCKRISDILAQELSHSFQGNALILRPCLVTSPGLKNQFFSFLDYSHVPHFGANTPFQFITADDLAECIVQAVDKGASGIYNIAGEGEVGLFEIAELADKKLIKLPFKLSKFVTALGWTFRSLPFPPGILSFLKYKWLVDPTRAYKEIYKPKLDSASAFAHMLTLQVDRSL